jgi:peroxiredoxin-like protein
MEQFRFTINGTWQGDRNGTGNIRSKGGLNQEVSVPNEFDGPGIGANPEELLISSSNNCYMITLASMLSNRQIKVVHLEVVSEGVVERVDGKLNFKQIIHRPVFQLQKDSEVSQEKLKEIAVRAEKACFISNTLRCSIDFSVEPSVIVK